MPMNLSTNDVKIYVDTIYQCNLRMAYWRSPKRKKNNSQNFLA